MGLLSYQRTHHFCCVPDATELEACPVRLQQLREGIYYGLRIRLSLTGNLLQTLPLKKILPTFIRQVPKVRLSFSSSHTFFECFVLTVKLNKKIWCQNNTHLIYLIMNCIIKLQLINSRPALCYNRNHVKWKLLVKVCIAKIAKLRNCFFMFG